MTPDVEAVLVELALSHHERHGSAERDRSKIPPLGACDHDLCKRATQLILDSVIDRYQRERTARAI